MAMVSPSALPAPPWCELHCHTPFTLLGAGSSIAALVSRAAALGYQALAITDTMTLAGVVRFHAACTAQGIRPITGCELVVHDPDAPQDAQRGTWIALARTRAGYANLCGLLTRANLAAANDPVVPLADLVAHTDGLTLLVGGCDGAVQRLITAGRLTVARALLERYTALLGRKQVRLEVSQHLLPHSSLLLARSAQLAAELELRCVATNGARYAVPDDMRLYDLLTCVRHGIALDEPHPARPHNREAFLKSEAELRPLFAACPAALAEAGRLAATCDVQLLAERCIPPRIPLPDGHTPSSYLRALCAAALPRLYPAKERADAVRQLDHELTVIGRLGLEEFFLTVWDIIREARARRIRCAGRGSAANSITAYLLGITGVDPLRHHLLFERFLNVERATMPDIDVDVASSRRQELIEYVEERYAGHEAMVANVVQYRLRLAVRDVAKALGFPLAVVNRLTRLLPSYGSCSEIGRYGAELAQVLARVPDTGQDAALPAARARWEHRLRLLLELVPHLEHVPRHLSLHNGGLLLTRWPLDECLPLRRSANGVVAIEIDKDDVEAIGMIKFDLLGLRTFDAIEHCLDLVEATDGVRPDVDAISLDPPDQPTMELIRTGRTLAVFQLESPAQWNLLSKTRPERFDDLVIQTSICRPGPIQAGMVHPYIARRAGRAPVRYLHPALEPILRDTLGVILFQEQILQIAHVVAGLTYGEADGFRKAISHYRTTSEMEGMRAVFLRGAVRQGIPLPIATQVFAEIACFSGYGFCRSHAASFAKAIYQTAYLKAHYPAHYLAGFLSAQPAGFFPPATVLHEARLLGIPLLPVDIASSREVYSVERLDGEMETPLAIRVALTQVKGVGEELARAIVAERDRGGPFRSLASFCQRMQIEHAHEPLRHDAVAALIRAGAFDDLSIPRRRLLWLLAEHWQNWQVSRTRMGVGQGRPRRRAAPASVAPAAIQASLPLIWPDEQPADAPRIPPLTLREEVEWDLATQGLSVRPHPLTFRRRELDGVGVVPIAKLADQRAGERALVAGLVISAQRPPTAKGTAFITLEDETGRVEAVVPPHLADAIRRLLAESRLFAISGRIERFGDHVTLLARALREVPAVISPITRDDRRIARHVANGEKRRVDR